MANQLPRIGVIIPASDTCLEAELPHRLAGQASFHFARVELEEVTSSALAAFAQNSYGAASQLKQLELHALVFGCTSGTFIQGAQWEAEFAGQLAELAGAPVITAATAMVAALKSHGQRVRLVAPYTQDLIAAEVNYLQAAGLEVVAARGLGIVNDQEIAQLTYRELAPLISDDLTADVTMISCTNVRTLGIQAELESVAGTPVVSSTSGIARAVAELLSL